MELAVVLGAVAAGVGVQRVSGMGLSLVAVPTLAAVLGPHDAIRLCLLLGFPAYALSAFAARHAIRWRTVAQLAVPAMALTPVFALIVRHTPQRPLLLAAGFSCLLAVVVLAVGVRAPWLVGGWGAAGAGVASAATNVMSGVAGPPAAVYGVNAGWTADETRGSLSAFFLGLCLVATPSIGLPELGSASWAAVLAGVGAGVAVGIVAQRVVAERFVRRFVLAVAAAGGLLTVVQAV